MKNVTNTEYANRFSEHEKIIRAIPQIDKRASLEKISSSFVMSQEIREITPPWGDPSMEKSEYSYDGNGNNTQVIRSLWENSEWATQGRGTITYDEQNREIELLFK